MSNKNIKIAISGKSGCGNSTVSKLLAEKLVYKMINYTFHNMAEEMNIDFKELCLAAEKDTSYDINLDKKQVELTQGVNCVLGSRLAIWLLKDADLKVYLYASSEVRSKRILEREGGDLEKKINETLERDKRDSQRYLKLYNIDNDSYDFADLVIDTSKYLPEEIVEMIINNLKK